MSDNEIIQLCERIGRITAFKKNEAVFGNCTVEIMTAKNKLFIVSDRDEWFAYIKTILHRQKRLNKNAFTNLIDLIAYLESVL